MNKVLICGGGTGGHVSPGLAVAAELRKLDIDVEWLGVIRGIEEQMVTDYKLHTIDFAAPTGGLWGYLSCLWRLLPAVRRAKEIIRHAGVKVVLGLGGYPSLPGVWAGQRLGCRCLLHEQNAVPGLANRFLAPVVDRILTSDPRTFAQRDPEVTGNPVRPEFIGIEGIEQRSATRSKQLRLLVIGGSQGARSLNFGVPKALAQATSSWNVAHACGLGNVAATEQAYAAVTGKVDIVEFMDDMPHRLAEADLVVCRAGASTVAELACVGVAAVLVPYPHARQHQTANASVLAKAGAAKVVADADIATNLAGVLDELASREKLIAMGEIARGLGKPQAASAVAKACQQEFAHAA